MLTLGHFSDIFFRSVNMQFGLFYHNIFWAWWCFIWKLLVLAFIETARLNTTSCSNFSWSWNGTTLVCKLYMPSLQIKTLISDISKNCNNLYVDRLLLVPFVKCILLHIIVFEIVLFNTFWRLWNIILEIVIHSYNKHYFVQIHLLLCWQFKSPSRNMKLVLLQQHEGGRCWSGKCVVFFKVLVFSFQR